MRLGGLFSLWFLFFVHGVFSTSIDWGNLNATTLSELPIEDFKNITVAELQSIPSMACSGFSAEQIKNIPPSVMMGFTSSQFSNLNGYACMGFNGFISYLDPMVFEGLLYDCFQNLSVVEMSADQIGYINVNTCGQMTATDLTHFNISQFNGWRSQQVATWDGYTCQFMTGPELSALSPEACSGFNSDCFNLLCHTNISYLSKEQVSALNISIFETIQFQTLLTISPDGASGLTESQIFAISENPGSVCFAFSDVILASIPPPSFAGFTKGCFVSINYLNWDLVTAIQLSYVPPSAFSGLIPKAISVIPADSFTLLTSAQVSNFIDCTGFSADQLAMLDSYAFSGFTSDCVQNIPYAAFSKLQADQVSNFTAGACGVLSNLMLSSLPNDSYAGFSPTQIASLQSGQGPLGSACSGITPGGMGHIPPESFAGFQYNCITNILPIAFTGITADRVAYLPSQSLAQFSALQMGEIPGAAAAGFTPDQMIVLNSAQGNPCWNITQAVIENFNVDIFPVISQACLNKIPPESFQGIKSNQFSQISVQTIPGLTAQEMMNIPGMTAQGFQPGQVSQFSTTTDVGACYGIQASHFHNMAAELFTKLSPPCVYCVGSETFAGIYSGALSQLSPNVWKYINATDMSYIPGSACSGLTLQQVQQWTTTPVNGTCAGITADQMSYIPGELFQHLSVECITSIASSSWSGVTAFVLGNLTVNATRSLTGLDMSYIPGSAVSGFSPAQIALFNTEGNDICSGISADQIGSFAPHAFTIFSLSCIENIKDSAFANISANDVAVLPIDTCKILTPGQLLSFPKGSFSGFNYSQFAVLNVSVCAQLSAFQVADLQPQTFEGLSSECVSMIPSASLVNVSASQIKYLSDAACSILSPDQFSALSEATIQALSITQLGNLNNSVSVLLTPNELISLIQIHNNSFVELYGLSRWKDYPDSYIMSVVNQVPDTLKPFYKNLPAGTSVAEATWLEITLIEDSSFDTALSSNISPLTVQSMMGLRTGQVPYFSPTLISTFTPAQAALLQPDLFSLFTAEQVSAISNTSFSYLNLSTLLSISPEAIKGLTNDQIIELPPSIWTLWNCTQISNITEIQVGNLTEAQKVKYTSVYDVCFPPLPQPAPKGPGFWTLYVIIGIGAGGGVFLLIIVILISWCCCCRKTETQIDYRPINS